MLVSRRSGAQRRKSCLKRGFDGEPDRNSEFCCQNRSDSIFRPGDNIIRNRRRIELNFNCRAVISHFQRFSFYCVCGSSMITMKVDNHGGNETKTIRVTVMGLWAFNFPHLRSVHQRSNAVIVSTFLCKTSQSINHRNHFHRPVVSSAQLP